MYFDPGFPEITLCT